MGSEERILKSLEDVQDCASFVVAAADDKDLGDYRGDRILRQAIERNPEIIGEAIGRIARLDPATASRVSGHRQIVAFRNRLIHGYDILDDELVWSTVKTEVPVLLSEVEGLLREKERDIEADPGGDLPESP